MSRTLFWYIFWDLLRIFGLASGVLSGIMSFGGLLRPLYEFGLSMSQVATILAYSGPAMTAYSLPIAALFATTIVYGRFGADNEVTACRAAGIHYLGMSMPAFPSASHANPSGPCVRSSPAHSAAIAGTAHFRRISGPAKTENTAMCRPLASANSTSVTQLRNPVSPP